MKPIKIFKVEIMKNPDLLTGSIAFSPYPQVGEGKAGKAGEAQGFPDWGRQQVSP